MSLLSWVLGRRLANQEFERRKINAIEGVPAMGLDGLGSSAYQPEAALKVLIPLGGASPFLRRLGQGAIVALLAIPIAS